MIQHAFNHLGKFVHIDYTSTKHQSSERCGLCTGQPSLAIFNKTLLHFFEGGKELDVVRYLWPVFWVVDDMAAVDVDTNHGGDIWVQGDQNGC